MFFTNSGAEANDGAIKLRAKGTPAFKALIHEELGDGFMPVLTVTPGEVDQ